MNQSKKYGVLLSYVNIVLGMMVNILLTPILIAALSDDAYSIYKVMHSFAGPLIMFNLGVSTIVARSVAMYRAADGDDRIKKENTFATAILVSVAMSVLVAVIGLVMAFFIPGIYGGNYSAEQMESAQWIFLIFVASTMVQILTEPFKGCISGRERFVAYYSSQTVRYILKFAFVVLALKMGMGAVAVAMVDLINGIIILASFILYSRLGLRERAHLYYLEKGEVVQILSFSLAVFLQAIVNQINNNVDIMLLGAMEPNKEVITMYSSALTIYSIYNSMITVFATVYFPQAARMVKDGCSSRALTDLVVRTGRMQAMVGIAVVVGFAALGKDFISLWIGSKYMDAYYVTLMLLIPVTIPLVENVCISVLDAQLKRMFRSVVLVIMAGINVVLSVVGIRCFGFWGAAWGTVISLIIGHIIIMNVYYSRVIGIEVMRMFKEIFRGTLPAGILAGAACIPIAYIGLPTLPSFLVKGVVFVAVYATMLLLFGMNKNEKDQIRLMLRIKK